MMVKTQKAIAAVGLALVLGVGAVGCSGGQTATSSATASGSSAAASAQSASAEATSSSAAASSEAASNSAASVAAEQVAYVGNGAYVSVDWLKSNIDNVVVVDARSAEDFASTHIPGAVNITWQGTSAVTDKAPGDAGWAALNDPADIAKVAAAAGIDGKKTVVVYTDVKGGWGEDGRVMWTLREAGIEDVKILDGGWRKGVGSKGATEDGSVANAAAEADATPAFEVKDADPIEQVDEAFVKEHLEDATIVDTRMEAEYEGQMVMMEPRMGRIPGAVSVPNVSLFNTDSTLKSDDEIDKIFTDAGLTDKDALIITYCTGGVRGANVAELLADRGFTNVKVYTCGFAEWAGDKDAKVEAEAEVPKDDEAK